MPGEIADLMLDGYLDGETGEVIDGDAPGYLRRVSDMNNRRGRGYIPTLRCRVCQRSFATTRALDAHLMSQGH